MYRDVKRSPSVVKTMDSDGEDSIIDINVVSQADEKQTTSMDAEVYRAITVGELQSNISLLDQLSPQRNTVLHYAASLGHHQLVEPILKSCPELFRTTNSTGDIALHLAAASGNLSTLKSLLHQAKLLGLFSPQVLMDENLEKNTALHLAMKSHHYDLAILLVEENALVSTRPNAQNMSPLFMAAEAGQLGLVQRMMQNIGAADIRALEGRSVVHAAIRARNTGTVLLFCVNHTHLPEACNAHQQRDEKKGETPLHLATKGEHARVVHILTWDMGVNLEIRNDNGLTTLDLAAERPYNATFQKRLTWLALRYAGAPQTRKENYYLSSRYTERFNTLLLMATLIATVTFAAGFTMPGGYNSSDDHPNKGMATLVKKRMFQIFVLSNTVAMYSSIIVAILLIWAMLNDLRLSLCSIKLAIPLLGISLSMVSLAFMVAISLVVSNVTWLANVVLIIGSISLLSLWIIFIPLSFPNSLTDRVSRYILRYPLYLLILATEK
ncbi:protein ACCELERATED CELL DEATH 6-like [Cornus florida]|uniref:protein ACCELERATED CELL DEATH 6-like n=1 Tax=Cornus florida TaxID=4283 RepID=UPI002896472F|nr:protein ACCELERATED CELL DEATH 6-like [Cornus florida]